MKDLMYIALIVVLAIGMWFAIPVFAVIAGTGLAVLFLKEALKDK